MLRGAAWCVSPPCKPGPCHRWFFGSFRVCELFPGMLGRSTPTLGNLLALWMNSLTLLSPPRFRNLWGG